MEIRFYKKQHAGRLSKAGAAHAPARAAGSRILSTKDVFQNSLEKKRYFEEQECTELRHLINYFNFI